MVVLGFLIAAVLAFLFFDDVDDFSVRSLVAVFGLSKKPFAAVGIASRDGLWDRLCDAS